MVKTPHTRHSATPKDPVTIDLAPGEVSRLKAEAEAAAKAPAAQPDPKPAPATTGDAAPKAATQASATAKVEPERGAGAGASDAGVKPKDAPVAEKPKDASLSDAAKTASTGEKPKTSPSTTSASGIGGAGSSTFGRQEPPRPAPTPEPTSRRSGGMLAGGVAGGVIALLVAGGLSYSGVLSGGTSQTDNSAQVAALEAQVAELRQRMETLGAGSGDLEALSGRLTGTDERVAALSAAIETLRAEVEGMAGSGAAAPAVDLAPLERRIAAIETAIAGLGGAANPEAALAAVEEQIETLRGEAAAAAEAQAGVAARIEAVEQAVAGLTQRVDEQAEAPATARIIAASALKAAVDRGTPFVTELDTYASLWPDAPEIAQLREMAAAGVPTRAMIAAESDAAANAMIGAARPIDPEAGFIDRLWGSAMGLVQVRPIGMVEGEGVPEIAARIDAAVSANDYERAIAEYETLPDTAKAAGAEFIARVRARHAADGLVDQALAAALKA